MAQSFGEFTGTPQTNMLTDVQGKDAKPEELTRPLKPTAHTVPMWDPDRGDIIDIPKDYAEHLKQVGWKYPDGRAPIMGEEAVQQEKSDAGTGGAVHLAAHNYLNSLLWGLPQLAKTAGNNIGYEHISKSLFESPEELQKDDEHHRHLEELHPIVGTVSDLAGYISPGGVSSLITKGLIKVGAHGAVEAGAKALEDKLFAKAVAEGYGSQVVKNAIGKTVGAGAKATNIAAHALGSSAEFGARGAVEEMTQEKTYDHQIDAERVLIAAKDDFGWGLKVEGGIQGVFGGLRGLRWAGSKTVDEVARRWPTKLKKIGTEVSDELGVSSIKDKTILLSRDFIESHLKGKSSASEKASTTARSTVDKASSTDVGTKARATTSDSVSTGTSTTQKGNTSSKLSEKEQFQPGEGVLSGEGDGVSLPTDGTQTRPTRFNWAPDADPENMKATWRQSFLDLADEDEEKRALLDRYANLELEGQTLNTDHVWVDPKTGEQHLIPASPAHAQLKFNEKKALGEKLHEMFPSTEDGAGFREHLDEYFNLENGTHRAIPEKELEKLAKELKPGTRTTTNNTSTQTTTKTKDSNSAKNTTFSEDSTRTKESTKSKDFSEDKTATSKDESREGSLKAKRMTNTYGTVQEVTRKPIKKGVYKDVFTPVVRDGIRTPLMYGAGALGAATGHLFPGTVLAGSMLALDTAIPAALNNRAKVAKAFDKVTKGTAKAAAGTLRAYQKESTTRAHDKQTSAYVPVDHAHYDRAVKNVTDNLNPAIAKENVIKGMGEHVASEHPILTQNLVRMQVDAATALAPHVIKDTRAPGLKQTPFNPPRSQKVKFLKLYHAVTQPLETMKNPSPAQMDIVSQLYPMHHRILTSAISGMLVANPDKIDNAKQRQLSIAMGSNYSSRQDPDYLQRLQMTAHIDETPQGPANGASHSGPKSAKVTNNAVNIDATPDQLNQLA
jgi:hypothetical protein